MSERLDDLDRLRQGLINLHLAKDASADALRSVAYDIALNCMDPETAEFQIQLRTGALPQAEQEPHPAVRAILFAVEDIEDDTERFHFLEDWLHGNLSDWPEFAQAVSRPNEGSA